MRALDNIAVPDSVEHRLELGALARFDATDLMTTYDALRSALAAINGVLNQPRCSTADNRSFTPAGLELERLAEHLGRCGELVVMAAKALQPEEVCDGETRSWLLLKDLADHREDLSEFAVLAARCAADNARAESLSRRKGSAE